MHDGYKNTAKSFILMQKNGQLQNFMANFILCTFLDALLTKRERVTQNNSINPQ